MPTIRETLDVPGDADEVFAKLADFRNTDDWDPGVRGARRTSGGDGDVTVGTGVEVDLAFGAATVPMTYVVTELEPPRRVVFEARNGWARARDVVDVAPGGDGGTRVTWEATFALRGPLAIVHPLLAVGLRKVGTAAISGLASYLGGTRTSA